MSSLQAFGQPSAHGHRLDSWKEIAAYLGREVRTVQRWEKQEALPVHRHRHDRGGTVYAFEHELDAWLASRRAQADAPAAPVPTRPTLWGPRGVAAAASVVVALAALVTRPQAGEVAADAADAPPLASASRGTRRPAADPVRPTRNEEAWRAYERGRYLWNRGTERDFLESARQFEQALRLDGDFAGAHAGLASARAMLGRHGIRPPADTFPEAKVEAVRALDLDAGLAEAHTVLAEVAFYWDWDFAGAEAAFHRALALDPGSARTHHSFAHFLSAMGRHDEALAEGRRAQELEPLSATINADRGWFLFRARRYEETVTECRRALELEPGQSSARHCVVNALEALGRIEEARAELKRQASQDAPDLLPLLDGADPSAAIRRYRQWRLARLGRLRDTGEYVSPYSFAAAHAALGNTDAALEWLERAYAVRDRVVVLLAVHPMFDSLRGEPRFARLVERVGLGTAPVRVAQEPSR